MGKEELSHEESLTVIQNMIDMAKNKINETGFHFMLWGMLVILASLTQYLMITYDRVEHSNWVWLIMSAIGVPIALIYEYKRKKVVQTTTKFDRIYGFLWLGFGITLAVTIFVSISFQVNPIAFILSLVGLATFVSGAIYRFKPLVAGAIIFWFAAILCTQFERLDQLLINAAAIFAGYIIPGILLWAKAKKEKNV